MVMRIVPPSVVPHPPIVLGVNVRGFWMPRLILISPSLLALLPLSFRALTLLWLRGRSPYRRRPVLRNVPPPTPCSCPPRCCGRSLSCCD